MKRFALIVLTDKIKVRQFEFRDDFDTARQTLVASGVQVIPLKWHHGTKTWTQPKVLEQMTTQSNALLRVCASCEWIYKVLGGHLIIYDYGCPNGNKAYRYAKTQKPWMDKKLATYTGKLLDEIDGVVTPKELFTLYSVQGRGGQNVTKD